MAENSSLEDSTSSTATSIPPTGGLLWVTTSVMNPNVTPSLLDAWYEEHAADVLACQGNGGLFLRYRNINKSVDAYSDPMFAQRYGPTASIKNIAEVAWPFLALIRLSDLQWLTSQQFIDMPRVSKLLPVESDGSIGSAFSNWHAGLRSFETVKVSQDHGVGSARPRYILSIQTEAADDVTWEVLDKHFLRLPEFCRTVKCRNVNGLLQYQEPGPLPLGLALYEFNGDGPPGVTGDQVANTVVRMDIWELTHEWGDLRLSL